MIPVMRPWLGEEEAAAAAEAVASGWVAQGPRVAEFEAASPQRVGAGARRRGVLVHDGAAPVPSCLLGIGPGDEVVVPSLLVHRDRERAPLRRRHARVRRRRPTTRKPHARDGRAGA